MSDMRAALVDRIARFLTTNYPCDCGAGDDSCTEESEADAIVELMEAAGYGLVADAKREALEEAADHIMGPSDVLLDGATCRWNAMELRERAAEMRQM